MRRVLFCVFLAALAVPQAAAACLFTQRPEPVGAASGAYFARQMLATATYADLVLVEDDGTRAMGERPTGVLILRTIARLKGGSADRFTLFGTGMTLHPARDEILAAPLMHMTSDTGQVTPFPYNEERPGRLLPAGTYADEN